MTEADVSSGSEYDVIVIGAGSTGENVADYAHQGGLSVALVEAELVGGDCSYWACMPSKALLRPFEALRAAQSVAGSRQAVKGGLDAGAVLDRRDSFTSHWDDAGQVEWVENTGITLIRGHARLDGDRRVIVTGASNGQTAVRAKHAVVVCSGSSPLIPPIPGLAEAEPWTTRQATSATAVPGRLAIIGGGVAGCEMAQAWRSLGSEEVTVYEAGPRLLPGNEPEAGQRIQASFGDQGIQVHVGTKVASVERCTDGTVGVVLEGGGSHQADEVLVAAGRQPRTDDLGLQTVGLEPGQWLDVDDSCQVTAVQGTWLYGAGDVNHRVLLTHMGKYQARICGDAIVARSRSDEVVSSDWGRHSASADKRAVPQVIFTEPQVAAVGLSEEQARQAGHNVETVDYELGNVAGAALYADKYDGWAKLVIDADRGVVLGATFVGPGVGEMIHSATVAIVGEVTLDRLWHAVPSYPTLSEVWLRLLEAYRKRQQGNQ